MIVHKTMTLPSSCSMCWLSYICDEYNQPIIPRWEGYQHRLDNCPLVEVKEKRVVANKKRITAYVPGGAEP